MNATQISKSFKLREFADVDKRVKVHPNLLNAMQKFRDKCGVPLVIKRGYITYERARNLGIAQSSPYRKGKGVWVSTHNLGKYSQAQLTTLAKQSGFINISFANGVIRMEVTGDDSQVNRIKVSKNFSLHEFDSRTVEHECMLHSKLVTTLQKYRDTLNRPLIITSGYRSPAKNSSVGGSSSSQHCRGTAVDISLSSTGKNINDAARIAEQVGFDGIGKYKGHIHVDTRGTRARWDYR